MLVNLLLFPVLAVVVSQIKNSPNQTGKSGIVNRTFLQNVRFIQ